MLKKILLFTVLLLIVSCNSQNTENINEVNQQEKIQNSVEYTEETIEITPDGSENNDKFNHEDQNVTTITAWPSPSKDIISNNWSRILKVSLDPQTPKIYAPVHIYFGKKHISEGKDRVISFSSRTEWKDYYKVYLDFNHNNPGNIAKYMIYNRFHDKNDSFYSLDNSYLYSDKLNLTPERTRITITKDLRNEKNSKNSILSELITVHNVENAHNIVVDISDIVDKIDNYYIEEKKKNNEYAPDPLKILLPGFGCIFPKCKKDELEKITPYYIGADNKPRKISKETRKSSKKSENITYNITSSVEISVKNIDFLKQIKKIWMLNNIDPQVLQKIKEQEEKNNNQTSSINTMEDFDISTPQGKKWIQIIPIQKFELPNIKTSPEAITFSYDIKQKNKPEKMDLVLSVGDMYLAMFTTGTWQFDFFWNYMDKNNYNHLVSEVPLEREYPWKEIKTNQIITGKSKKTLAKYFTSNIVKLEKNFYHQQFLFNEKCAEQSNNWEKNHSTCDQKNEVFIATDYREIAKNFDSKEDIIKNLKRIVMDLSKISDVITNLEIIDIPPKNNDQITVKIVYKNWEIKKISSSQTTPPTYIITNYDENNKNQINSFYIKLDKKVLQDSKYIEIIYENNIK